ncbi:MAG: hypothetical protein NWP91_03670, partial [Rickettsiaceae bacterium]|nr:hypothetical protein [Rickettsiaceae bacterium]
TLTQLGQLGEVLRLLDANRAIEARQSEIDAHTIGTKMTFSSQQAARYQKSFNWPECICL